MVIEPQNFDLLLGRVTGISERLLLEHFKLYRQYVERFNSIQAAYPVADWGPARDDDDPKLVQLLATQVKDLNLAPAGPLADALDRVVGDLRSAGIEWTPNFYLGKDGFFTPDRSVSVNIPWYLANEALWKLSETMRPGYDLDQVTKALRHETGHALGFAYELWKRPIWQKTFGDPNQPYPPPGDWKIHERDNQDFVDYLTFTPEHYAQKHPDEDWAEAFAAWLDPATNWRERWADKPNALRKLHVVAELMKDVAQIGPPPNTYLGRVAPYQTSVPGTVAEALEISDMPEPSDAARGLAGWSEHSELLRRDPVNYNAIVLHENYFSSIDGYQEPGQALASAVTRAFTTWESYMLDLRTIMASTHGWAVTTWDPRTQRVRNTLVEDHHVGHLAGAPILLAIDCWEHAYAADYATRKDLYAAAVFRNLNWLKVNDRLVRALG